MINELYELHLFLFREYYIVEIRFKSANFQHIYPHPKSIAFKYILFRFYQYLLDIVIMINLKMISRISRHVLPWVLLCSTAIDASRK